MAYTICSKNGAIIPINDATVSIDNIEYAYGFGVYESIRVVRGKALFLEQHLDRLMQSAKMLELDHPFDHTKIAEWIAALIKRVEGDALNLKILLIGARDAKDALLWIIPLAPYFPEKKLYTRGASALTFSYERFAPHAKTLNMLGSYIAYRKAKKAGCYDALLLNKEGCITEGTRTNFFAIKDSTIISPPLEEILEGVTRLHVLEVAKKNGYTIEHRPIPLADLATFDGACITSTSSKIMPLTKIDEQMFEIPEKLKELMRLFDAFVDNQ